MIYPSREFQVEQSKAVESQQSLRDEAEEHYQLLKTLSQTDAEYQRQLKLNFDRKAEVKRTLQESSHWQITLKRLQK